MTWNAFCYYRKMKESNISHIFLKVVHVLSKSPRSPVAHGCPVSSPPSPSCGAGWFDAWGALTGKSFRDPADVARTLRDTLDAGASVNFFVFHGGTSFGFCGPGGNISNVGLYEPQVTSYDYGGLLDEAGEVTEKYLRCQEVLADFLQKPELLEKSFPMSRRLPESPPLELEASLSLEESLPVMATPITSAVPVPAEQVGLGYGYIMYRTKVPSTNKLPLTFGKEAIRDFASVMTEGRVLGTIYRNDTRPGAREFDLPEQGCHLEVLVDMMGRVNFGPALLTERKGLVGPGSVQLGSPFTGPMRAVLGWEIFPCRWMKKCCRRFHGILARWIGSGTGDLASFGMSFTFSNLPTAFWPWMDSRKARFLAVSRRL
jgi:hypothetical protein